MSYGVWLLLFIGSTLYKPANLISFSIAAAVSALALDLLIRREVRLTLPLRLLSGIGLISYSLYLWHEPMVRIFPALFGQWMPYPLAWMLTIGIALITAAVSYHVLEKGGIALGKAIDARMKGRRKVEVAGAELSPE